MKLDENAMNNWQPATEASCAPQRQHHDWIDCARVADAAQRGEC